MQSIVTCAVTLILLMAQSNPKTQILGKWQSIEATDGFGSLVEFRNDGFCFTAFRIVSNRTYKIEDDRIFTSGQKSSQGQDPDGVQFRIEGARLFFKTSEGEIALDWMGNAKPSGPAIVGKWGIKDSLFPHRHGAEKASFTYEFTEDGRFTTIIQGEPQARRYSIKGKWLTMRINGESRRVKYRFEDEVLVLESFSEAGREERYRRVEQ